MSARFEQCVEIRRRGSLGESLAASWLSETLGMLVRERNWRNPRDRREELDLICSDRGVLVFVEVKTRTRGGLVRGYASVDSRKRLALRRSAFAYLASLPGGAKPRAVRFDVVEVLLPAACGADDRCDCLPRVLHFANVPLFHRNFVPR